MYMCMHTLIKNTSINRTCKSLSKDNKMDKLSDLLQEL